MKTEDLDRMFEVAIKKDFNKEYALSTEDVVMKRIYERGSKNRQIWSGKHIYIAALLLCIVVECYIIFSPLTFLSVFNFETDFSLVLVIQSVGVLAALLQIDAIYKARKQSRFLFNTNPHSL
jgi:hypothetical protein